jgi:hypothetical protein
VAKARDRLAELEVETVVPTPDQSEAASRLRDRIWRQIEKIPEGPGRDRTIMSMAEKNPIVADAIREMPKELAGISASTYQEIATKLLEATHGPELQEINDLREGSTSPRARSRRLTKTFVSRSACSIPANGKRRPRT